METLLELKQVLINISEFDWSYALYLEAGEVWNLNTKCAVLDPNDVEDDDEELPTYAKKNKLVYVLTIQEIKGIIKNAYQQKKDCSEDDLLKAFVYYYDNDAFIT